MVRVVAGGPGVFRPLAGIGREPPAAGALVKSIVPRGPDRVSHRNGGLDRRAHVRLSTSCGRLGLYLRKTAVSVTSGTLAKAFDSGQSCFAPAASFWNVASSTPGTFASSRKLM